MTRIAVGLGMLLFAAAGTAQSARQEQTLASLLQQGITAFEQRHFEQADVIFTELEAIFGREPEFQDASVQHVILPLRGYAALLTADPAAAVEHLGTFLHTFPDDERRGPFVRFILAQSQAAIGDPAAARQTFRAFAQSYPDRPEAAMALIRAAELAVELDETDAALEELDAFYHGRASFALRQEAQLRALQIALNSDRHAAAARILAETPWSLTTMPEIGALSFAALKVATWHAHNEDWAAAIRAYRLVWPRDRLVALQAQRQAELRARIAREPQVRDGERHSIWSAYYQSVATRTDDFLRTLRSMEDYTGPALLHYGIAYASTARFWEAETVFISITKDPDLPTPIREEAHYRAIVTAHEREDWHEVLASAESFATDFPAARQAPLALFLAGNALQNLQRFDKAIAVYSELMERYPDHPFFPRFLFARGFVQLLSDDHSAAREDFASLDQRFPDQPLATNARYWHAMAWYFERRYVEAQTELDALLSTTPHDHYMVPEMLYRRATVRYAQRAYDDAREQLEAYLARYPEHASRAEAQVLLGDTYMGLGELLRGAIIFAQIGPEAGGLFPYAIFQSGKIFRALEDYERMAEHFTTYARRSDLDPHPRTSEALYWVGWAREQQGRATEAVPLYLETLDRYGNEPSATGMQTVLRSLETLHQRIERQPQAFGSALPPEGRTNSLLQASDFDRWLEEERKRALATQAYTFAGRIVSYLHDRQQAVIERLYSEDTDQAIRLLDALTAEVCGYSEIIPQAQMDAKTLAVMGEAWRQAALRHYFAWSLEPEDTTAAEREHRLAVLHARAHQYLEDLLTRFPQSPHRADAYQTLAKIAGFEEDAEDAARWLKAFIDAFPGHPLYPATVTEWATFSLSLDRAEEAVPLVEALLRLRSARGRPHAEAVFFLAQAAEQAGHHDRALAYYQNVYNLYRAYPDLVTPAYLRSAHLFEARDDPDAAYRTYREMTYQDNLLDAPTRALAAREMSRLAPLVSVEDDADATVSETTAAQGGAE